MDFRTDNLPPPSAVGDRSAYHRSLVVERGAKRRRRHDHAEGPERLEEDAAEPSTAGQDVAEAEASVAETQDQHKLDDLA